MIKIDIKDIINYRVVIKILLALFAVSFAWHFLFPTAVEKIINSEPKGFIESTIQTVKDTPKNAANYARETIGLETPKKEATLWQQAKALVSLENMSILGVTGVLLGGIIYGAIKSLEYLKKNG